MKREEKEQIISGIVENLSKYNCFYITDVSDLTVEKTNQLRRLCFSKDVKMNVAKNTLIRKALEKMEGDYSPIFAALKEKGIHRRWLADVKNQTAPYLKELGLIRRYFLVTKAWIRWLLSNPRMNLLLISLRCFSLLRRMLSQDFNQVVTNYQVS